MRLLIAPIIVFGVMVWALFATAGDLEVRGPAGTSPITDAVLLHKPEPLSSA